jgi:hypothetical protein
MLANLSRDRATGCLTVEKARRESQLLIKDGCWVGAHVGFGYQTVPQALFNAGLIDAHALDALWARGTGVQMDSEMLEALQLDPSRCRELHALANLRSICEDAEATRFDARPVEELFEPIPLERLLASLAGSVPAPEEPSVHGDASWGDLLEHPLPSHSKVGQR